MIALKIEHKTVFIWSRDYNKLLVGKIIAVLTFSKSGEALCVWNILEGFNIMHSWLWFAIKVLSVELELFPTTILSPCIIWSLFFSVSF